MSDDIISQEIQQENAEHEGDLHVAKSSVDAEMEFENLRQREQFLFKESERLYLAACESSEPNDWMAAAMLAKQHRFALVKLDAVRGCR